MNKINKRIEWIDIAKGIGIILVVIGHVSQNEFLNYFIYSFHMPLFFILSGYLYKEKEHFVKKKAKSILIPYFIFSFLTFSYWYMIERKLRGQTTNPMDLFINIFVAKGGNQNYLFNAVMWFLPCLFITEILFYFLQIKIKGKYKLQVILFVIILCSMLGFIYPKITLLRLPYCIDTMLTAIVFYDIGYLFKNKMEKFLKKIKSKKVTIIFMILILFLVAIFSWIEQGANLNELKYNYFSLFYMVSVIGSLFIYMLSNQIHNKMISYLGKNSLIIMCIHEPIKRVVIIAINKFTGINNNILRQNLASILLITIITIAITIPIIILINKFFPYVLGKGKEKRYVDY